MVGITQSLPSLQPVVDDSGFDKDPLLVEEYSLDIFHYLRQIEVRLFENTDKSDTKI